MSLNYFANVRQLFHQFQQILANQISSTFRIHRVRAQQMPSIGTEFIIRRIYHRHRILRPLRTHRTLRTLRTSSCRTRRQCFRM
jgi:hypothetical protein